jgi:hypothetical protein
MRSVSFGRGNCASQSCTLFASLSKALVAANFHVSSLPWKSLRFAPAYQFPYSGFGRRSGALPQQRPFLTVRRSSSSWLHQWEFCWSCRYGHARLSLRTHHECMHFLCTYGINKSQVPYQTRCYFHDILPSM